MSTLLDEFKIIIGIDGEDAKKGMNDVTNSIKSGMQNIKSSVESGLSSVSKIFTGFGAAIMGAMSIGSAFSTWKEQAAELGAASRNLKMSMEDLQGWTGAMGKFGGTTADFENTVRGLNGQLARMATVGTSRAGKLLESIGIDPGEIGRQRNALDVLEEMAGVMETMTPDEARGIGAALGLDSATIMLLQQGRDGMRDLIREKKESAIYTKEDADAIKAYNVAMGGLKKNFMGIASVLFRMITPALTTVTKYISQFVGYIRKHQNAVKAFFVMIAALVTGLLIPSFLAFARAVMANPLTWVIMAIAALALVIEDFIVWLDGGNSALERFWNYLFGDPETAKKNIEEIKERLGKLVEDVKWFFDYVMSGEAWARLKENAGNACQRIKDRWQILQRDVRQWWDETTRNIQQRWERVVNFLPNQWARFNAWIAQQWADLQTWWDETTGSIETRWNEATAQVQALWNDATSQVQALWQETVTQINNLWEEAVTWIQEQWQRLTDAITEALETVQQAVQQAYEAIQQAVQQALDWVSQRWEAMKNAALAAIGAIVAAITGLGSSIREAVGSAVDWAMEKLSSLRAAISGGSYNVEVSAGDAGGNTTNTSYDNRSWSDSNVTNNYNNTYNNYGGGSRFMGGSSYMQANGGTI